MQEITTQLGVTLGVLAFCFAGPAVAIYFLLRRKRVARARRRSPLSSELLRGPGHSLREQLIEAQDDLTWDLTFLVVLPSLILTLFMAQWLHRGPVSILLMGAVYAIFVVGLLTYYIRKLIRAAVRLDQLRAGFDAELAADQELDQLMRLGAYVFHDVPAENFNIDHVVISSTGVFAVETKGYTKEMDRDGKAAAQVIFDGTSLRFPSWTTKKPLEQAERQAAW
ncbi:MAG: NERD domain-containing protein, partial [Nitrospirota bacterium]|nr:NERD domain-containing protein [Nitrospirota bacterium]